jgi:hypothetical protein
MSGYSSRTNVFLAKRASTSDADGPKAFPCLDEAASTRHWSIHLGRQRQPNTNDTNTRLENVGDTLGDRYLLALETEPAYGVRVLPSKSGSRLLFYIGTW